MYASTATITHNNGIQLTLEQSLAPNGSSGSSGSTSSTGTASSGDQTVIGKVQQHQQQPLNNAIYLNNLRNNYPVPPPPYVNQFNRLNHHNVQQQPVSLPASVRATPTPDFELYHRHLRTNSYTQATQQHYQNQTAGLPRQIYNAVQSTPSHRRYPVVQQQYQLRQLNGGSRSGSCNSILNSPTIAEQHQMQLSPAVLNNNSSRQLLYDKIHGRQSSSSAG
jgi:hypothetical protein